jgi:GxxExxY protein
MELNEMTYFIRMAIFEVHNEFGPGLLESVYEASLKLELENLGLKVEKQLPIPVSYKGTDLGIGFRLDLLVEKQIIIEIKSVEFLHNVHKKQLLTYLKLCNKRLGFLINFNDKSLVDKISLIRVINGF